MCPFSNFTRNVAFGRFSRISPCIWMTSSFAMRLLRCLGPAVSLLPSEAFASARLETCLLQQRLVLLTHHVRLDLSPEVHRHDHQDQQRRAPEVERNVVLQ